MKRTMISKVVSAIMIIVCSVTLIATIYHLFVNRVDILNNFATYDTNTIIFSICFLTLWLIMLIGALVASILILKNLQRIKW
jgi:hypothetical protein